MKKIKDVYTKKELKEMGIGAPSKILEKTPKNGEIIYVASTPYGYNYNGFVAGSTRCYIWDNDSISLLFYNLSSHRAKKAIRAYNKGDVYNKIPSEVWENYIHNGYNTRMGLYADYTAKLARMQEIANSHADYLGCETGDSSSDHVNRVAMRNR